MTWLGWILLGLVAGLLAKALMPGRDPGGLIITTILGIVGALLGGWLGSMLGLGEIEEFFDLGTWLLAIGGAILVLVVYRLIAGRRRTAF